MRQLSFREQYLAKKKKRKACLPPVGPKVQTHRVSERERTADGGANRTSAGGTSMDPAWESLSTVVEEADPGHQGTREVEGEIFTTDSKI